MSSLDFLEVHVASSRVITTSLKHFLSTPGTSPVLASLGQWILTEGMYSLESIPESTHAWIPGFLILKQRVRLRDFLLFEAILERTFQEQGVILELKFQEPEEILGRTGNSIEAVIPDISPIHGLFLSCKIAMYHVELLN